MPTRVKHRFRWRGSFIPADIWDKLSDGTLGCFDVLLAVYIDNLVSSRGVGCYASNRFLAKRFRKSPHYISAAIAKLKKHGILQQIGWVTIHNHKLRWLETSWSRAIPNNFSDEKMARIADKMSKRLKGPVKLELMSTVTANRNGALCIVTANRNGTVTAQCNQGIPPNGGIRNKEHTVADKQRRSVRKLSSSVTCSTFDMEMAKKLFKAIKDGGRLKGSTMQRSRWGPIIKLLRKELQNDKERLQRVLEWFIATKDFRYNNDFIPHSFSARSFREDFIRIEAAMDKSLNSPKQNSNKLTEEEQW